MDEDTVNELALRLQKEIDDNRGETAIATAIHLGAGLLANVARIAASLERLGECVEVREEHQTAFIVAQRFDQ